MANYKAIGQNSTYKPPQPWIFKPVLALRLKMIVFYALAAISCYIIILGIAVYNLKDQFLVNVLILITVGFIVISMIMVLAINKYYTSFEFQVHGTEIIVKSGLINITENHVPFSNITNIAIRRGPFDQFLGIGSILIYTAGQATNPLRITSIVGIRIYQDVAYFILAQIKTFESYLTILTGEQMTNNSEFSTEFLQTFYAEIMEIRLIFET